MKQHCSEESTKLLSSLNPPPKNGKIFQFKELFVVHVVFVFFKCQDHYDFNHTNHCFHMYILLSTPNDFKQGCIQHNQMLLLTVRFTSLNTITSLVSSFGLCLRSPKTWTQRSGNTYITYLWLLSLFLRPHSLLMICANHPQCCCNGEMLMDKDIHTHI